MVGVFYQAVGVGVASVAFSDEEDSPTQAVVSLMFPKSVPVYPDDPEHEDNFNDVFISIPAAKTLLIDLRDAIEAATTGKPFV